MKKYLLLLNVIITIAFSGCNKDQLTAQKAVDDKKIQLYLSANNIKATKDPSGVYYEVITPGTGAYPISSSNVKVTYTGKFLDGVTFDSETGSEFLLSGTVAGFQYGIPHINAGGRILIIVPSWLGYGSTGSGTAIPANSVLVFTLDLLSFY